MSVWPQYVMLAYFDPARSLAAFTTPPRSPHLGRRSHALSYVAASVSTSYILHVGNFFASLGWPA
jgi:hypothetical protein